MHTSDAVTRRGRISKEGQALLRGAMTQAATVAVRSSKRRYLVHEALEKRQGKKAAKVSVARRLLNVAYHILTRHQPYQEEYGQQTEVLPREPKT